MKRRISIIGLGLLMSLLAPSCMTSEYASSRPADPHKFVCKAVGEISPSHYALEGVDSRYPKESTKFIKCPSAMNRELAKAPDLEVKLKECLPKYQADLKKADCVYLGEQPQQRTVLKKGEVRLDVGRDPKDFDTRQLNLIWTVPADIVTSPIQLIMILVYLRSGIC